MKFRISSHRSRETDPFGGESMGKWTQVQGFKYITGKNNGFPFLDILGYLKNTHKNPKFGKVRQVPTGEFPTKFPDWDLSHSSKFGILVGIL